MTVFYAIEISSPHTVPNMLDKVLEMLRYPSVSLVKNGSVCTLVYDDTSDELGSVFQHGSEIYVSWEQLSIGASYCWLVTHIVGQLLGSTEKLTVSACSSAVFTDARRAVHARSSKSHT
jgi:hypothetical protein